LPPKRWHYIHHAITPGRKSSPASPPPRPSIFGWLLCGLLSVCGHLRPHRNLFLFYFWHSICRPKQLEYPPPRAQTPAHLLSQTPLTASTNFWQIVVCCGLTAAIYGQDTAHLISFNVAEFVGPNKGAIHDKREPNTVRDWYGPIGSRGTMCCGCRWPTHGVRG